MIGRTIGKYRIVGQIGRGGSGVVYKATDETLHRDVAIKTLNPDLANTEVMKRFRAEATILAKLNHPQIATIYELYRSDTDLLMVMEYVRGETLDKLSTRVGPMPPEHASYLIDQILSALEHAHRAGVVHRDMKPSNVMVAESGGVKIMDFGIARVRGAEQMTVDGRLMGTPAYMPPEQVLGQEVDGRADLYSVGVVLHRLLTGGLPFTADTALGMLQQQILETPMLVRASQPELPEWCDRIVQRALAKSPADRFQTAEEFREDLGRATGVMVTDIAKVFAIAASAEPILPPQLPSTDTLDMSRGDTAVEPSMSVVDAANEWMVRRSGFAWALSMVAMAALTAAVVAYVVLRREPAEALAAPAPRLEVTQYRAEPGDAAPAASSPVGDSETAAPTIVEAPPSAVDTTVTTVAPEGEPERPRVERTEEMIVPRRPRVGEPLLVYDTKTLVGTRRPREHDAQLVLAEGRITVTPDIDSEYPFYSIPYANVVSINFSRGRDPMWISPDGPAPVTRGGGALSRLGIVVARDWITLRTNTKDQFVPMRFDEMLVRRVLLALEERTGRRPQLIAQPREPD